MATTYSVETIEECVTEMGKMWALHWQEIALDKDTILLDPDVDSFIVMEQLGGLQIVTARDDGRLIGYHVTIVRNHLHYKSSLTGYVDMYFIHPDYRKGRTGLNLFKFAENKLIEMGCKRIFTSTKLHKDMGKLLEYLGHRETERVYVKNLGV
jgi:N-acetylglutamate synthase-like GNAT family acetyltransferase